MAFGFDETKDSVTRPVLVTAQMRLSMAAATAYQKARDSDCRANDGPYNATGLGGPSKKIADGSKTSTGVFPIVTPIDY